MGRITKEIAGFSVTYIASYILSYFTMKALLEFYLISELGKDIMPILCEKKLSLGVGM